MTLDDLNRVDPACFVRTLGAIYERSPWVAERVAGARPFASLDALARAMAAAVATASTARQRALIHAHPDLEPRLARPDLTEASRAEQSGLRLSDAECDRLAALNRAYRARFGFPFIIAVRRHAPAAILSALAVRLDNDPDTERRHALAEIDLIAALRLADLIRV